MPTILAIDQSTSATKALLYAPSGRLLDKVSIDHRQIYPQPGWVEHDAEEIWQNTLAAAGQLLDRNPAEAGDIGCLSISNQRETVLVFDKQTGRPIGNAIVWQCRRGDDICRQVLDEGHGPLVTARTGLRVDSYFSASKLAWLMQHQPETAARLAGGDALIGTIDTYLIHRLTEGEVFATDHTNASRTLLFDIHQLRWDTDLCRIFGVPMGALPRVRESTSAFGRTDLAGRLPRAVPIRGVMGDSQAALLAHRCHQPGSAKVTLGTGSSVLLNVGPRLEPAPADDGAVGTIAWTHRGTTTYCLEGIINYAAATLTWLRDQLGLIQSPAESEQIAAQVGDNGGVYLVPAFAGLSAPYWAPDARGAIVGMTAHTRREHIVRAALESIAYQVVDVLAMMRQQGGVELGTICADGGASRNAVLMQFLADVARTRLVVSPAPDCAPQGAALAGALGMGWAADPDAFIGAASVDPASYEPRMPDAEACRLRRAWQRAVQQVLASAEPSR